MSTTDRSSSAEPPDRTCDGPCDHLIAGQYGVVTPQALIAALLYAEGADKPDTWAAQIITTLRQAGYTPMFGPHRCRYDDEISPYGNGPGSALPGHLCVDCLEPKP